MDALLAAGTPGDEERVAVDLARLASQAAEGGPWKDVAWQDWVAQSGWDRWEEGAISFEGGRHWRQMSDLHGLALECIDCPERANEFREALARTPQAAIEDELLLWREVLEILVEDPGLLREALRRRPWPARINYWARSLFSTAGEVRDPGAVLAVVQAFVESGVDLAAPAGAEGLLGLCAAACPQATEAFRYLLEAGAPLDAPGGAVEAGLAEAAAAAEADPEGGADLAGLRLAAELVRAKRAAGAAG